MLEDAERADVLAAGRASRAARTAPAALRVGVDDDALADLERARARAAPQRGHAADELVAQDHAGVRGVAGRDVEDLEVAAADPARLDFDDDVVVRLDDRLRDVLEGEDAGALEDRGPHQPACRRRRIRPVNRRARPSATPARPSVPSVRTSMTVATALTSGVTPNFTLV